MDFWHWREVGGGARQAEVLTPTEPGRLKPELQPPRLKFGLPRGERAAKHAQTLDTEMNHM